MPSDGVFTVEILATDDAENGTAATRAQGTLSLTYTADNSDPTGSIVNPSPGGQVAGTVYVSGTAADIYGLATSPISVAIWDVSGSTYITPPNDGVGAIGYSNGNWSFAWDVSNGTYFFSTQEYRIDITITDAAIVTPNTVMISRTVTKDPDAPSITITQLTKTRADATTAVENPPNGTVVNLNRDFIIEGTASDTTSISSVIISFDGGSNWDSDVILTDIGGGNYTWSYDTTALGNSPLSLIEDDDDFQIMARASDGTNNVTAILSLYADVTNPDISLASHVADEIYDDLDFSNDATDPYNYFYGDVPITGTASDDNMSTVEIRFNSDPDIGATYNDGDGTWSYTWPTATDPIAELNIDVNAVATDLAGNEGIVDFTADVRPRITGFAITGSTTKSAFINDTLTINGYNFGTTANTMVSFDGAADQTPSAATSTQLTIDVPGLATSGDFTVDVTSISSNTVNIDIWDDRTDASDNDTNKAADQDMMIIGSSIYHSVYQGGNAKDFYAVKNYTANTAIVANGGNPSDGMYNSVTGYNNGSQDIIFMTFRDSGGNLAFAYSTDSGTSYTVGTDIDTGIPAVRSVLAYHSGTSTLGVAYQDANGFLHYRASTNGGSTWTVNDVVDNSGAVGQAMDLAFSSAGIPMIAYYDEPNTKIKFAHKTGGTWSTMFVENSILQGESPSIEIDGSGGVHVAYYDGDTGSLKYAYASSAGSAFTVHQVNLGAGINGFQTAIGLNGSGEPSIGYLNFNFSKINLTRYIGTDFTPANIQDDDNWLDIESPVNANAAQYLQAIEIGVNSSGNFVIGYSNSGTRAAMLEYRP